jgi:hypothetical protein
MPQAAEKYMPVNQRLQSLNGCAENIKPEYLCQPDLP